MAWPFSHLFPELQISPIELQISPIQLQISPIQSINQSTSFISNIEHNYIITTILPNIGMVGKGVDRRIILSWSTPNMGRGGRVSKSAGL